MKPEAFNLLENASWPALLVDESGRVVRANRRAAAVFGQVVEGSNPLLASIWSAQNTQRSDEFLARLGLTAPSSLTLAFQIKGGQVQPFNVHWCTVGEGGGRHFLFQCFTAEASVRESAAPAAAKPVNPIAQQSLAQKQKLECALQLARTVALDFNNALTSILGHTSLMLARLDVDSPWRTSLLEVEKSAERAAEIAADLAIFSRQEKEAQQRPGDINLTVKHTVDSFQHRDRSNVNWRFEFEPSLFAAVFDGAKFQQALAKLLENAVQAMPTGGDLTIRTENLETADGGSQIQVTVIDSGEGIPASNLPRVFEPFFTTREGRRGLGLAWVYGIVSNHGGSVQLKSTVGEGTTVKITLPATRRRLKAPKLEDSELTGGGRKSVLMVDDEELVLTLGETVLNAYGYRVQTAQSGARALKILQESPEKFDLLVTDLVMPQMNGRELAEQVRKLSPETRILCSSGYVRPDEAPGDEHHYLQKPFTSQQLLLKVKQVLS